MRWFAIIYVIWVLLTLEMAVSAQEIRGECTDLGSGKFGWSCKNFPGFYYDLDQNICTEQLSFRLSDIDANRSTALLSDKPDENGSRGVLYVSKAEEKQFKFLPWGCYKILGFLGEGYFAAYSCEGEDSDPFLFNESENSNLMADEQISRILIDDDTERTVTSKTPLELEAGYALAIRSMDADGNKLYLELSKAGQMVDAKVISPSKLGATMVDRTYYYKRNIGNTKDIVIIAVHFKNALRGADTSMATVDGIFQVSDVPLSIKKDQKYDKMSICEINSTDMTLIMDNKDRPITLSKNKDISLMGRIRIRTADQRIIDMKHPLRYCIYSTAYSPDQYQIGSREPAPTDQTNQISVAPMADSGPLFA